MLKLCRTVQANKLCLQNMQALMHWKTAIQAKVFHKLVEYRLSKIRKRKTIQYAFDMHHAHLQKTGLTILLRAGLHLQENQRVASLATRAEETEVVWSRVRRIAQHWRYWTIRQKTGRCSAPPLPSFAPSSVVLSHRYMEPAFDTLPIWRSVHQRRPQARKFGSLEDKINFEKRPTTAYDNVFSSNVNAGPRPVSATYQSREPVTSTGYRPREPVSTDYREPMASATYKTLEPVISTTYRPRPRKPLEILLGTSSAPSMETSARNIQRRVVPRTDRTASLEDPHYSLESPLPLSSPTNIFHDSELSLSQLQSPVDRTSSAHSFDHISHIENKAVLSDEEELVILEKRLHYWKSRKEVWSAHRDSLKQLHCSMQRYV